MTILDCLSGFAVLHLVKRERLDLIATSAVHKRTVEGDLALDQNGNRS